MSDHEAKFSTRTQPRRPKTTRAEHLAQEAGHTITLEEYRRCDGGVQPLYARARV